jgi:hypothetical protein
MYLKLYTKTDSILNSLRKVVVFSLVALLSTVYSYGQGATGLNFDGVNDNVTIPVKPELNIANAITIESWIYPTKSGSNTQDVLTKAGATVNSGYIFPRTSSGWSNLVFRMRPNGANFIEVVVSYNLLNAWHHVAATYDGFKMKVYIDGILMGQRDYAGQISINNNDLTLGNQPGYSEYFGGSLDEVRVWNRALSQCEIVNNMHCELGNIPSQQNGLAAYYKLNQGLLGLPNPLVNTVVDSSPSGGTGTLNNFGLVSGLLSNWTSGTVSATTCTEQVFATVTAGSASAIVPYSGRIELNSSGNGPGTYSWVGPNGYTSNLQNPVIEGVPLAASGTYTVTYTNQGGCAATASVVVTVAAAASGLNFDGINDQVIVPYSPSFNTNTFSVESWIYPISGSTFVQDVVSNATRFNNTGFRFPRTTDKWSSFSFEMYINNQWKTLSYTFPVSAIGRWNHVAATFDGYFMRIYLNGGLVGTMEVAGTFSMNTNNLVIGNEQDRAEYFQGSVDELRIWSRALSQCEIINNMQTCELNGDNNGLANQVGLAAYYRFNQGLVNVSNPSYTVLADSSGHGNNGTLQNFNLTGLGSNWVAGKVNGLCAYFPLPTLTASANASVFQTGTTAKLFANNGNGIYNWDGPNGFSASLTQNPVLTDIQPIQSGTYTVTNPYVNCVVKASTRIKISNEPQLIANGPTALCPSTTVTLSPATAGLAYQWYKNDTEINGANGNEYVASQAGNYSVKITSGTDIIISAPIAVTEIIDITAPVADAESLPTLHIVAPGTVTSIPTAMDECRGRVNGIPNMSLTFARGGTYIIDWTYDDLNGNKSHQLQTVEVADVIAPVIIAPAPITINANGTVCGAVVNFAATATDDSGIPVTITYSQDPNTVFTVGNHIITITATDAFNNTATGTFTITVLPTLVVPVTGTNIVCVAATTSLAAGTGGVWSSDNTNVASVNQSGVVTGIATGTANIIYTNACGGTGSILITVKPSPATPVISVANNCGSSVLTTATPDEGSTLLWSVNGATTPVTTVSSSGNYTVTITNAAGCTATSLPAAVSINVYPVVAVITGASSVASGSTTQFINATDGGVWSSNSSNATVNAAGLVTGVTVGTAIISYTLVNPIGGCVTSQQKTITVISAPTCTTPVFTNTINNVSVNAVAGCTATATYSVGVSGTPEPAVNYTFSGATTGSGSGTGSGSVFNSGTTTVVITATNSCGTVTAASFTVIVSDATAPVITTAVANQTFCVTTATYTIPAIAATDNCSVASVTYQVSGATNRSGTGANASGAFNAGVSTITWTVKDASNNTTTASATVTVGAGPVATIAANSATDFCGGFVLTGSSSVNNASYKWMQGNVTLGTSQQLSLGQSSAEGSYQLYVTANGCTGAAANYNFQKQNLLSSYTILAYNDVTIGKYNKVATGSVGIMSSGGKAEFGSYSSVAGPNSFVKSPDINVYGYGINISRQINGIVSIPLPVMQYNTASTKYLSNYNVSANSTVTLSSNYNNLKVKKGAYVTLTGNTFGTIDLEEGASVRFTSATINIGNLLVEDGAKDGYYSYVRFAPNTSVRVSAKVSIGSQVLVNPDNNKVTFYMGDNKSDEEKFTVKGADTKLIANIYMPNGKLKVTSTDSDDDNHGNCDHKAHSSWYCAHRSHNHKDCDHRAHNAADCNDDVYMTGMFIVEKLESKGNTVIWNSFDCGSGSVPVVMATKPVGGVIAQATAEGKTVSSTVSTEEELKVTVMPNPSTTYFTLRFESKYETPVNIRVMDASGRVVDTKSKIGANSTIQIGAEYAGGTYYAEMTQGTKRKVVQLIKLRG